MRPADLPLIALAVRGQHERALARAHKYPHSAHRPPFRRRTDTILRRSDDEQPAKSSANRRKQPIFDSVNQWLPHASRRAASASGLRSEEPATSDEGRRRLRAAPEASGKVERAGQLINCDPWRMT